MGQSSNMSPRMSRCVSLIVFFCFGLFYAVALASFLCAKCLSALIHYFRNVPGQMMADW
jgi:hypothetical protein